MRYILMLMFQSHTLTDVKENITKLLKKCVIGESTSVYASPTYDTLPLAHIDICFDKLHGARFFSMIDLSSG